MNTKPHIAILENDFTDNEGILEVVLKDLDCQVSRFSSKGDVATALVQNSPDIILMDYTSLTGSKPVINFKKKTGERIPTIIFSDQLSKKMSVELLREGAIDCVSKQDANFRDKLAVSLDQTLTAVELKKNLKQTSRLKKKYLKKAILLSGILILAMSILSWIM